MTTLHFTEGGSSPPSFAGPSQLLPNVVDGLARSRPEASYAMIPKSFTSYEDGYRRVTYRQLANAINGAARLLTEQLGPTAKSQVLAYAGPNDLGYVALILGAVKAGHKLLILSPRNTQADHASLCKRAGCEVVLTLPPPYSPIINNIITAVGPETRTIHVPTFFQLLEGNHSHVPYPKTFAAAKDETLVIMHTSGTTNTPKLVPYTHAFAASYNRMLSVAAPEGFDNLGPLFQSQRLFTTYPMFHAGGVWVTLLQGLMNQDIVVTGLAAIPPSAQGIADALTRVEVDVIYMVAPFVEQMAKNPEMLSSVLANVKAVAYGGADVSQSAADAFLAKGVTIAGFIGSTEAGAYPLIRAQGAYTSADLKYIQLHPAANFEFRPVGTVDFCEAIIVRNKDSEDMQPIFYVYPELQEYNTNDLFSPHPEKPGLWLYRGRADDIIISATGERFNPVPFEQGLAKLPQVSDVLMVGTGRYQKALLIEPANSSISREEFLDSIWSVVEECNQTYPQVCRIVRDHVLLTEPGVPLKRAGKGSVQRLPSLELYKEQIDTLYSTYGDGEGGNAQPFEIAA